MSAAFSTKWPRTSGSETHASGKNGAVNKNGAVGKYSVLPRNDALEGNAAQHNAATTRRRTRRRARPNGPGRISHARHLRSVLFTSHLETPIRGRTGCQLF